MSSVAQHLMTAEEYENSPLNTTRSELVRGEVIETPMPGALHGGIVVTLGMLLGSWAKRTGSGRVAGRAGFILAHNPDTVRGPDLSFVRAERISSGGIPHGF